MRRLVATLTALTLVLAACENEPASPTPTAAGAEPTTPATTTTVPPGCDDDLVDDVVELLQDQLDALAESPLADVIADPDLAARSDELAARAAEEECPPGDLVSLVRLAAGDLEAEGRTAERYRVVLLDELMGGMDEP